MARRWFCWVSVIFQIFQKLTGVYLRLRWWITSTNFLNNLILSGWGKMVAISSRLRESNIRPSIFRSVEIGKIEVLLSHQEGTYFIVGSSNNDCNTSMVPFSFLWWKWKSSTSSILIYGWCWSHHSTNVVTWTQSFVPRKHTEKLTCYLCHVLCREPQVHQQPSGSEIVILWSGVSASWSIRFESGCMEYLYVE